MWTIEARGVSAVHKAVHIKKVQGVQKQFICKLTDSTEGHVGGSTLHEGVVDKNSPTGGFVEELIDNLLTKLIKLNSENQFAERASRQNLSNVYERVSKRSC